MKIIILLLSTILSLSLLGQKKDPYSFYTNRIEVGQEQISKDSSQQMIAIIVVTQNSITIYTTMYMPSNGTQFIDSEMYMIKHHSIDTSTGRVLDLYEVNLHGYVTIAICQQENYACIYGMSRDMDIMFFREDSEHK